MKLLDTYRRAAAEDGRAPPKSGHQRAYLVENFWLCDEQREVLGVFTDPRGAMALAAKENGIIEVWEGEECLALVTHSQGSWVHVNYPEGNILQDPLQFLVEGR